MQLLRSEEGKQADFPPLRQSSRTGGSAHHTQFLTLAALDEVGSAAVNALAERLDIERTAMGKMVGFLERDGFVTIRPSPTDGRSRLVELTEKGRRLHDRAAPLWREAQREFEQLNGVENVTALREGLRGVVVGDVMVRSAGD